MKSLLSNILAVVVIFFSSAASMAMDHKKAKRITIVIDKERLIQEETIFNIKENDSVTIKTPGTACKVVKHFNNFYLRCDKVLDARDIELAALECYEQADKFPARTHFTINEIHDWLIAKTRILFILKAGDQANVSLVAEPKRKKMKLISFFDLSEHDSYRHHLKKIVLEAIGASSDKDHTVNFIAFLREFKRFMDSNPQVKQTT